MKKIYERAGHKNREVTIEKIDDFIDNLHGSHGSRLVTREEFHMFFKKDYKWCFSIEIGLIIYCRLINLKY